MTPGKKEWVRDASGNVVHSRLDEQTLRDIAEATGGQYYPLGQAGNGLMDVRFTVRALDSAGNARSSAANGRGSFSWAHCSWTGAHCRRIINQYTPEIASRNLMTLASKFKMGSVLASL